MAIKQVRFSHTLTKSINESSKHMPHCTEYVTQFTSMLNSRQPQTRCLNLRVATQLAAREPTDRQTDKRMNKIQPPQQR